MCFESIDTDPPLDYANDNRDSDDANSSMHLVAMVSIALLHTLVGLGAGWLLWG